MTSYGAITDARADKLDVVLSTIQDGRTKDVRYRQRQFLSLHSWITTHVRDVQTAVQKDDSFTQIEAQFLLTETLNALRGFYDGLDLKEELVSEYSVKYEQDNAARRVSEDLTYVIPETRAIFFNVLSILYACIAAGSCCLIELPENPSASVTLIDTMFQESLDRAAFATVTTRPSNEVLSWHLIVDQTGSFSNLGLRRLSSDKHCTSAVSIVDRTANLELAAQEILKSRTAFSGKGYYAPSYILVNEFVEAKFTELLDKYASQDFSSPRNGSKVKIGSNRAASTATNQHRLQLSKISNRAELWETSRLANTEEVTILATSSHDDAIDAVNAGKQEALLALYVFADPPAAKYLTQFIRTRISFVNHIPTTLLVRPPAPVGYPVSSSRPYSCVMIGSPSPIFVHQGANHATLQDLNQNGCRLGDDKFRMSLCPLKPMGQAKEGNANFFQRALLAGVVVYVVPVLAFAVGGSVALVRRFRK